MKLFTRASSSYFFMFAHWSVMRERSIAAIFWKNCFPVIKHNPFQLACLTSASWAKRGKRGIYVGYFQWKRCLQVASYGKQGKALPEKIPRIEVRVAAQQRVSTKFLKLKQSITRKKMNRKSKKGRTWKVRHLKRENLHSLKVKQPKNQPL